MLPGDQIVRVDGRAVTTWDDLEIGVTPRADRDVEFVVMRGGAERTLTIRPITTKVPLQSDTTYEIGTIGVLPAPVRTSTRSAPVIRPRRPDCSRATSSSRSKASAVYSRNVSDALRSRAGQPTQIWRAGAAPRDDHRHAGAAWRNAVIGITGQRDDHLHAGTDRGAWPQRGAQLATAGVIGDTLGGLFTGDARRAS